MTAAKPRGKGAHTIHEYTSFPNGTGPLVVRRLCRPNGALYLASGLHFQREGEEAGWSRLCPDCQAVKELEASH